MSQKAKKDKSATPLASLTRKKKSAAEEKNLKKKGNKRGKDSNRSSNIGQFGWETYQSLKNKEAETHTKLAAIEFAEMDTNVEAGSLVENTTEKTENVDRQCNDCLLLRKEVGDLKSQSHDNFKIIKQKMLGTSELITEFHQKKKDLEVCQKSLKEANTKLDRAYGETGVLRIQLEKALQANDPLKRTLKRIENEKSLVETELEDTKVKVEKAEAHIKQMKSAVLTSRIDQQDSHKNKQETIKDFEKEKKKVLNQAKLIDKLNLKLKESRANSQVESRALRAALKENEKLKMALEEMKASIGRKTRSSNNNTTNNNTRETKGKASRTSPNGVLSPSPSPPSSSPPSPLPREKKGKSKKRKVKKKMVKEEENDVKEKTVESGLWMKELISNLSPSPSSSSSDSSEAEDNDNDEQYKKLRGELSRVLRHNTKSRSLMSSYLYLSPPLSPIPPSPVLWGRNNRLEKSENKRTNKEDKLKRKVNGSLFGDLSDDDDEDSDGDGKFHSSATPYDTANNEPLRSSDRQVVEDVVDRLLQRVSDACSTTHHLSPHCAQHQRSPSTFKRLETNPNRKITSDTAFETVATNSALDSTKSDLVSHPSQARPLITPLLPDALSPLPPSPKITLERTSEPVKTDHHTISMNSSTNPSIDQILELTTAEVSVTDILDNSSLPIEVESEEEELTKARKSEASFTASRMKLVSEPSLDETDCEVASFSENHLRSNSLSQIETSPPLASAVQQEPGEGRNYSTMDSFFDTPTPIVETDDSKSAPDTSFHADTNCTVTLEKLAEQQLPAPQQSSIETTSESSIETTPSSDLSFDHRNIENTLGKLEQLPDTQMSPMISPLPINDDQSHSPHTQTNQSERTNSKTNQPDSNSPINDSSNSKLSTLGQKSRETTSGNKTHSKKKLVKFLSTDETDTEVASLELNADQSRLNSLPSSVKPATLPEIVETAGSSRVQPTITPATSCVSFQSDEPRSHVATTVVSTATVSVTSPPTVVSSNHFNSPARRTVTRRHSMFTKESVLPKSRIERRRTHSPLMSISPPLSPIPPSPRRNLLTPLISPLPITPLPITPLPDSLSPLPPSPKITSPPLIRGSALVQSENSSVRMPVPVVHTRTSAVQAINFTSKHTVPPRNTCNIDQPSCSRRVTGEDTTANFTVKPMQCSKKPILKRTRSAFSQQQQPPPSTHQQDKQQQQQQQQQQQHLDSKELKTFSPKQDCKDDDEMFSKPGKLARFSRSDTHVSKKINPSKPPNKISKTPVQRLDTPKGGNVSASTDDEDRLCISLGTSDEEQASNSKVRKLCKKLPSCNTNNSSSVRTPTANTQIQTTDRDGDKSKRKAERDNKKQPVANKKTASKKKNLSHFFRNHGEPEKDYGTRMFARYFSKAIKKKSFGSLLRDRRNVTSTRPVTAGLISTAKKCTEVLLPQLLDENVGTSRNSSKSTQLSCSSLDVTLKNNMFHVCHQQMKNIRTPLLTNTEHMLMAVLADVRRAFYFRKGPIGMLDIISTEIFNNTQLLSCELLSLCRLYSCICRMFNVLDTLIMFLYEIAFDQPRHISFAAIFLSCYTVWPCIVSRADLLNFNSNADNRWFKVKLSPMSATFQFLALHDSVVGNQTLHVKLMNKLFLSDGWNKTDDMTDLLKGLIDELYSLLANEELSTYEINAEDSGYHLNAFAFSCMKALTPLCRRFGWERTYNYLITDLIWSDLKESTANNIARPPGRIAVLLKLIGQLVHCGTASGFGNFEELANFISKFLSCRNETGSEGWGAVEFAAASTLVEVLPHHPEACKKALHSWTATLQQERRDIPMFLQQFVNSSN